MSKLTLISILMFSLACGAGTAATEAELQIAGGEGEVQNFTGAELARQLPRRTLTVKANPAYGGARKTYRGYDLIDLLRLGRVDTDASSLALEVTTADGWKAPAYELDLLKRGQALLAIEEVPATRTKPLSSDGRWSMVVTKTKTLSPGPYYLVWNDPGRNPDVMPLQVAKIQVTKGDAASSIPGAKTRDIAPGTRPKP